MSGRPKKSNELKRIQGTDQPCRMSRELEAIQPLDRISIPSGIKSKIARKIFKEKAAQLISIRVLTALDVDMLILWANTEALVFECMEELEKGKFNPVYNDQGDIVAFTPNPYLKVYKESVDSLTKLAHHFGFSPMSRSKIFANVGQGKQKNAFDDF